MHKGALLLKPFDFLVIKYQQMKTFESLRVVFMGTPAFAVASLDALRSSGVQVVGVVTAPDKQAGRGLHTQQSAVKAYAMRHDLPVLQPEKLRNPAFLASLRALNADLQVVVAFRMLPEMVWDMPPMGTINLHGSLLPKYRGAAPINWAVINGEKETGVTTFKLQHAIDTGNILLQESLPIAPDDTAGTVHDKLMRLGAELVVKTLKGICDQSVKETPQAAYADGEPGVFKEAPKLFAQDGLIDFNHSAEKVHNLIRGLSPFPAAYTELEGKKLKVYQSHAEKGAGGEDPGTMVTDQKTFLKYRCQDGYIYFDEVQLAGKKKMDMVDFLRGYRFKQG